MSGIREGWVRGGRERGEAEKSLVLLGTSVYRRSKWGMRVV
jgi:hypothetical protein